MKKQILTLTIVLLAFGGIVFAGTLEDESRKMQLQEYQDTMLELNNALGATTSGDRINRLIIKVFDMEKDYNTRIDRLERQVSNLKEENLAVRRKVKLQEEGNIKRQDELKSLLSNIVLILMSK